MQRLETLHFENTYARLPDDFYHRIAPTPLPHPYPVGFNEAAARLIDLDPAEAKRPEFIEYFAGNRPLPGSAPLAMLYSGHQFGVYVPQLGDGRAVLLGEVRNRKGERWELQLKGAGKTRYSRGGDGRAVLRSTIREYLCSEAMEGLGIPTTRALCIVGSDEAVFRERAETAAVLTRLAPSHVRFGSFQIFYYRKRFDLLQMLADTVIAAHFPEAAGGQYPLFLKEIVLRTARLMADWQAVGFAHGVMNTDNMSILGLTFDYGPFGFIDRYEAGFICNHSDSYGRYAFNRQPQIGLWNLGALAQALTPLIPKEALTEAIDRYEPAFNDHYRDRMAAKLGLSERHEADGALIVDLLALLEKNQVDYPSFFRGLGDFKSAAGERNTPLRERFIDLPAFDAWADRYRRRLAAEGSRNEARKERMARANPKYILRNYLAQIAIQKATDERDYSEIDRLRTLLQDPFSEQPAMEKYAALPPDWAKGIQLSCSS